MNDNEIRTKQKDVKLYNDLRYTLVSYRRAVFTEYKIDEFKALKKLHARILERLAERLEIELETHTLIPKEN